MRRAPSAYLGFQSEYKDRLLELAYTIYEDGMCDCGWPKQLCRDPDNNGWFELPENTTVCQVRAVIDRETAERRANPNYQPEPGELLGVIFTKEEGA